MVEPTTRDDAIALEKWYACSACWRPVVCRVIDEKYYALCPFCGEEMPGYVTQKTVKIRMEQDHFDYMDAMSNLGILLGLRKKRPETEILKELGF